MKNKKYIASCSFGKDSLAMIIKIKELGLPLDEVIYIDIRYNDVPYSGEQPLMQKFIPEAKKLLKERYNIEVIDIKSQTTFKEQFYKTKKRGKHIGDIYGFPHPKSPWCNSCLKIKPLKEYLKKYKDYDVYQYIGIAYDEQKRYDKLKKDDHKLFPLVDLKIKEKEAMEICKNNNLLSPIYGSSFRGGCWFCSKQRLCQLKNLYVRHNDLFNELKKLEKDSFNSFRNGYKLEELEERFKEEIVG